MICQLDTQVTSELSPNNCWAIFHL